MGVSCCKETSSAVEGQEDQKKDIECPPHDDQQSASCSKTPKKTTTKDSDDVVDMESSEFLPSVSFIPIAPMSSVVQSSSSSCVADQQDGGGGLVARSSSSSVQRPEQSISQSVRGTLPTAINESSSRENGEGVWSGSTTAVTHPTDVAAKSHPQRQNKIPEMMKKRFYHPQKATVATKRAQVMSSECCCSMASGSSLVAPNRTLCIQRI